MNVSRIQITKKIPQDPKMDFLKENLKTFSWN